MNTKIGDILGNFFSPYSHEKKWIMWESDDYTRIVRNWSHVISSMNIIKANLKENTDYWNKAYKVDACHFFDESQIIGNSYNYYSGNDPLGTSPTECAVELMKYFGSTPLQTIRVGEVKFHSLGLPNPFIKPIGNLSRKVGFNRFRLESSIGIQTDKLHTASIGSYHIYVLLDDVDIKGKTAKLSVWMHNVMSRGSLNAFEPYASALGCGMKSQHMWWNWKESHAW